MARPRKTPPPDELHTVPPVEEDPTQPDQPAEDPGTQEDTPEASTGAAGRRGRQV